MLNRYEDIVPNNKYTRVLTSQRLPTFYIKDFQLKLVVSNKMLDVFRIVLQIAYTADYSIPNQQIIVQSTNPIYQQKRFGFNNTVLQRRVVYRRSDFVKYRSSNIGRIDQILTYSLTKQVRVFVEITPTTKASPESQTYSQPTINPIVELSIYKIAIKLKKLFIIGLLALGGQKVWIVLFKRGRNTMLIIGEKPVDLVEGNELIYIDQDVQQLQRTPQKVI